MCNAIHQMQLSPARAIAAKYSRDFYLVFHKSPEGPVLIETSSHSAGLDQLVEDILETNANLPCEIDAIMHVNPVAGISRLCDREVAEAVADRTHQMQQTPCDAVIQWLEEFGCDYFQDDEHLSRMAEEALRNWGDYRRDLRVQAYV